ncbi:anthranilate 1,2-dioxygenase regulatory protein AndR [Burkholderia gladioli]|uniref:AraC-type DNA-binding domain-containing protein n=2 Tax=Burkholderia gladioli TaxID=28095 RepID=F2LMR6_BURGS|nr:anthranilate 1,2-dioxygenase regulatory protein AndR [Burkholderia gladioli]AEA64668.1 AraC-type DNA-binding domain-containing protein [Burkholderia gladioli BSR3]MBW5287451.1 AraC family transcriptional regulator [Burkholderia gladioli]NHH83739.1 Exoenzyme S synthesis regulatory protein ExsA [Burkholderia gladioli]
MSPTLFDPLALRAHRLFESRDLDETRERISRVMQPHALVPGGRRHGGAAHMDFVRLGRLGLGAIAFGEAMQVRVDAVDGYHLLMFCVAGHARVRAGGRLLAVDGRTGVICAPGETFDAELSADCEQFVMRIDAAALAALTDGAPGLDPVVGVGGASLAPWFQQLMLVARSPDLLEAACANPRVADRIEQLLLDLLVDGHPARAAGRLGLPARAHAALPVPAGNPAGLAIAPRRHDPAPAFVRRAQEFVETAYAQPLQLADIVAAAGVPERTLREGFLQFRGLSPTQFLRATRLEHAREMLGAAAPGRRIADIALDCGFAHLGRFAIAYRERFGESPSDTLERR